MVTRPKPASLQATAKAGDELATLRRLRDMVAADIDALEVGDPGLARLAPQLVSVLARVSVLEAAVAADVSVVDELRARRGRRRVGTA